MTTIENRPNTALLVIDVQNGVVADAYARDTVVANVGTVVDKARAAEVPVVWVQHSSDNLAQGSEQWKIVPELSPDESEPLVQKRYPDSFEETTLESVLDGLAVGRIASGDDSNATQVIDALKALARLVMPSAPGAS